MYLTILAAPQQYKRSSSDAKWFFVNELPKLSFDHAEIVDYALIRLKNKLEYTTVGFQLLPEKFTLTELQKVYEVILNKKLDKRNFRRKIELLKILTPLKETKKEKVQRPARLHKFSAQKFENLKNKGILFPF